MTLSIRGNARCLSSRRRHGLSLLLGTVWLGAMAQAAEAQAVWTGTISTNWFTAGNWTPGAVPVAASDVQINNGGVPNSPIVSTAGAVASTLVIGGNAGQSGALTVTGAGTLNVSAGGFPFFLVGDFGTGTLTVSAGGTLTTGIVGIGNNAGSTGTATVTGAGSVRNMNNNSDIGSSGIGTLDILAGGRVNTPVTGYTSPVETAFWAMTPELLVTTAPSAIVSVPSLPFMKPASVEPSTKLLAMLSCE